MGNLLSNQSTTSAFSSGHTPFTSASPMELGVIHKYKPPSAPSVKEFRHNDGLCMYCGEAGHQVVNCPNKGKKVITTGSLGTIVQEDMIHTRLVSENDIDVRTSSSSTNPNAYPLATTKSRHPNLLLIPVLVFYGPADNRLQPTEAMVDTGASNNFVSRLLVDKLQLEYFSCPEGEEILFRLANNTTVYVSSLTAIVPIRIANTMHEELLTLRVIETASF